MRIRGQEVATFNLALHTLGFADLLSQTGALVPSRLLTAMPRLGRTFFLGDRMVSGLTLTQGELQLNAGIDFTLDAARGMIYFSLQSSVVEGGGPVSASYTRSAVSLERVKPWAAINVYASVHFAGVNVDGIAYDAELFHVQIKATGGLSLITLPNATEDSSAGAPSCRSAAW